MFDSSLDPFLILPDEGESFALDLLPVSDRAGEKNIRISGAPSVEERGRRVFDLVAGLWGQFLEQHLATLRRDPQTSSRARALLVTASYAEALVAANGLARATSNPGRIRVVLKPAQAKQSAAPAILPREIEGFPSTAADILIAPLNVVARGHNIVAPGTSKSAIASVFVLVRPVLPADDAPRAMAHLSYRGSRAGLPNPPGAALLAEIRDAEAELRRIENSAGAFGRLPKDLQQEMVCDILVDLVQLAGRARRGGTDVQMYLVDAAFDDEASSWKRILKETLAGWKSSGVLGQMRMLHGPIVQAIQRFVGA